MSARATSEAELQACFDSYSWMMLDDVIVIELDDVFFLQEPPIFDGKNPWVSGSDFPLNQSNDIVG